MSFDCKSHQVYVACLTKPEKIDRDLGILRDNDVVGSGESEERGSVLSIPITKSQLPARTRSRREDSQVGDQVGDVRGDRSPSLSRVQARSPVPILIHNQSQRGISLLGDREGGGAVAGISAPTSRCIQQVASPTPGEFPTPITISQQPQRTAEVYRELAPTVKSQAVGERWSQSSQRKS